MIAKRSGGVRRPAPPAGDRLLVDLHVHTCYSNDSLTTLSEVIRWARRRELGALAITDHNTIDGALALAAVAPFPVIIGEEIRTAEGDIIGLFMQRQVPAGLSPLETAQRIHDQGGLVYVPHPFDRARASSALGLRALLVLMAQVDLLETLNARVTFRADNDAATALARHHRLPAGAGSDAHQGYEIGRAGVALSPFADATGLLNALRQGSVVGDTSGPLVHLGSTYAKLAKSWQVAARRRTPQPSDSSEAQL
jgi:hypothetical protein